MRHRAGLPGERAHQDMLEGGEVDPDRRLCRRLRVGSHGEGLLPVRRILRAPFVGPLDDALVSRRGVLFGVGAVALLQDLDRLDDGAESGLRIDRSPSRATRAISLNTESAESRILGSSASTRNASDRLRPAASSACGRSPVPSGRPDVSEAKSLARPNTIVSKSSETPRTNRVLSRQRLRTSPKFSRPIKRGAVP